MQLKEFSLVVDIKGNRKNEYIEVIQGDYETNVFNIQLMNGLKTYSIDDVIVDIVFKKANNEVVIQEIFLVNATEGKFKCVLDLDTIDTPGMVKSEIRIKCNDVLLTTSSFEFYVRKSII